MSQTRSHIVFWLNNEQVFIDDDDAFMTLSQWLRQKKGLTGVKVVCSEGDCGACTVIVGWLNAKNILEYRIIDSCIQFLFQLDLCHIITIEGLEDNGKLHSAQIALMENFGSQCGFCTPGIAIALAHLHETREVPDSSHIREKLGGNLCRCTGYEAIVKSGLAMSRYENQNKCLSKFEPGQIEKDFLKISKDTVRIAAPNGMVFFKPANLREALKLKTAIPDLKIVAGATDLGVLHNKGKLPSTAFLFIAHLHEIAGIKRDKQGLHIGATTNWTHIYQFAESHLPQLHDILRVFAAEQIRNLATIGGNVINASPIADSIPCLMALDSVLEIQSTRETRYVNIQDFYKGYKQFDLRANEILTKIVLPLPSPNEIFRLYKVSKRRELDIATVTMAIRLGLSEGVIEKAIVVAGGVAAVVLRLSNTEKFLQGKPFNAATFLEAGKIASGEINPLSDVRGSAIYRKKLVENLLTKCYQEELAREKSYV